MTGAGRPRVALHPGAERAQHLGDDEVGAGVYHAPDNDPVGPEGAGEGALSLFAATPALCSPRPKISWKFWALSTPTFGRKFLVRVTQAHD